MPRNPRRADRAAAGSASTGTTRATARAPRSTILVSNHTPGSGSIVRARPNGPRAVRASAPPAAIGAAVRPTTRLGATAIAARPRLVDPSAASTPRSPPSASVARETNGPRMTRAATAAIAERRRRAWAWPCRDRSVSAESSRPVETLSALPPPSSRRSSRKAGTSPAPWRKRTSTARPLVMATSSSAGVRWTLPLARMLPAGCGGSSFGEASMPTTVTRRSGSTSRTRAAACSNDGGTGGGATAVGSKSGMVSPTCRS